MAGSALAWELMQRGKSVMVIDQPTANRASAVAAGLFNPITGRVMTKAWKADLIFPFLQKFYHHAEKVLNKKFFFALPIYCPFLTLQERNQWKLKSESSGLKEFLHAIHGPEAFTHQVVDPFGGIEIAQSGYLRVNLWMSAIRDFLREKGSLQQDSFLEQDLSLDDGIRYKEYYFTKIIFCNGLCALDTHRFRWLPLEPLKGEMLEVRILAKPERIYNQGVYLVPSDGEHVFKVGATYEHSPFAEDITQGAREELGAKLRALIRLPYEIIHQEWGIRPTTSDRRPLLGAHPQNKNVIIFNGLGTKGVSLAPYFAHQLADWLDGKGDLSAEVNINRFKALYSG